VRASLLQLIVRVGPLALTLAISCVSNSARSCLFIARHDAHRPFPFVFQRRAIAWPTNSNVPSRAAEKQKGNICKRYGAIKRAVVGNSVIVVLARMGAHSRVANAANLLLSCRTAHECECT
jgi:hypothetical protein